MSFGRTVAPWLLWCVIGGLFTGCVGRLDQQNVGESTPSMTTPGTNNAMANNTSPANATTPDDPLEEFNNLSDLTPMPGGRQPARPRMLRLTEPQFTASLRAIFGESISWQSALEPDERNEAFSSIGASKVGTSPAGVEKYRNVSLEVAASIMAQRDNVEILRDCAPVDESDACFEGITRHFGRLLWRRALTEDEVARYAGIPVRASADLGRSLNAEEAELALTYILAGLIQSPHFLYVPMVGAPVPNSELRVYTDHEVAARLALLLWGQGPDDILLAAAEAGSLTSKDGLEAQVDRMLEDPRARSVAGRFFAEHWLVDDLEFASKSSETFEAWSPELLERYRTEFELVIEDVVFERDADIRELITGNSTFVDAELARIYGIEPPAGDAWEEVELPSERIGLLTSGAVISANSKATRTSPTVRGVFVLEHLLCESAPPPPPSVADDLDESTMVDGRPATVREQLALHSTDPACSGCHALFDPLGLTMEHFDGIGIWRDRDRGFAVDDNGLYLGTEFDGVHDLANWLAEDDRTSRCIAQKFYAFANARKVSMDEQGYVDDIAAEYALQDHSFKALIKATILSSGWRTMRPALDEPEPEPTPEPTPEPEPTPDTALFADNFDGYEQGDDPMGWVDTDEQNALTVNDALFYVGSAGGGFALTTFSELVNIHSHYITDASASWTDYEVRGRMVRTELMGGVGVTAFSDYPDADHYYRLRAYGDTPFHIAAHGTEMTSGTCTSQVQADVNVWFRFRFQVEDRDGETVINAKLWPDGEAEPEMWQIRNCGDSSANRRTRGHFGVWSMRGPNSWDDLEVIPTAEVSR